MLSNPYHYDLKYSLYFVSIRPAVNHKGKLNDMDQSILQKLARRQTEEN